MLFNSYIFVFLFLPCALLGYFLLNNVKKYELAKCFLIGMSLWFYAYFEEMRETQFVIFFPPYSILYWYNHMAEGSIEARMTEISN